MTTSPALTAAPTSERTLRRDPGRGCARRPRRRRRAARRDGPVRPAHGPARARSLRGVGLALVGYVVALAWASRARPLPRRAVGALVVANWAWVAASAVLLATLPATPFGVVYVIGQAVVVAGFAVAEARGLARLPDSSAP